MKRYSANGQTYSTDIGANTLDKLVINCSRYEPKTFTHMAAMDFDNLDHIPPIFFTTTKNLLLVKAKRKLCDCGKMMKSISGSKGRRGAALLLK